MAVRTKPGRADRHQKARGIPAPPGHAVWLGWVILGTLAVLAAGLAIAAGLGGR